MDSVDPAGEYLRISERYRQMSDEELLVLMRQSSELTPFAQQALASEARSRGLQVEIEEALPSAAPRLRPPDYFAKRESREFRDGDDSDSADLDSPEDDAYEEDRKLVEICTVWSARDALQLQDLLDAAGIPFFLGEEKATGVDAVTSAFSKGVSVRIMQIGVPWARSAMQRYVPLDDLTPKEEPTEVEELAVRCPRCHSEEVVFEGGTSTQIVTSDDTGQKFKWSCDACGHRWEDDGLVSENQTEPSSSS
jgi:DNA-directed RNA polymerase subunit M/transcription elongation factor TFIIS